MSNNLSWEDLINTNISKWESFQRSLRSDPLSVDILGIDWMAKLSVPSGVDPETEVRTLLDSAKALDHHSQQRLWLWKRFPYIIRQVGLVSTKAQSGLVQPEDVESGEVSLGDELVHDIDEWVIQNENFMRFASRKASIDPASVAQPWTYGLVELNQLPLVLTQPHELTSQALRIHRPTALAGFTILGEKRSDTVSVRASQVVFNHHWTTMTDGVLDGLEWSNVFVAGGSILGATICPPTCETAQKLHTEQWKSSDIDVYLFGLDLESAVAKIKHIAQVYRSNLPPDSPFLVARTSQTLTLYSTWPTKRIQIVLRLVGTPRDVLLNFDLDPCTIGYDGAKVWMLPRFVRSLETGYTTFTMDLASGHHLGDRKATRLSRMLKYADKGFGVRFLPSDVASLRARGEDLQTVAEASREWTSKCIELYKCLHYLKGEEPTQDGPEYTFRQLDMHQPRKVDALRSFGSLMRHISLWEKAARGEIKIRERTHSIPSVEEGEHDYDETPKYSWDENFTIPGFCNQIEAVNNSMTDRIQGLVSVLFWGASLQDSDILDVKRISYSEDVDAVWSYSHDLRIPLILPRGLLDFANDVIVEALEEKQISVQGSPLELVYEANTDRDWFVAGEMCVAVWNLDMALNWQMLDRRIDEVREALWRLCFGRSVEDCVSNAYGVGRESSGERDVEEFVNWVRLDA